MMTLAGGWVTFWRTEDARERLDLVGVWMAHLFGLGVVERAAHEEPAHVQEVLEIAWPRGCIK